MVHKSVFVWLSFKKGSVFKNDIRTPSLTTAADNSSIRKTSVGKIGDIRSQICEGTTNQRSHIEFLSSYIRKNKIGYFGGHCAIYFGDRVLSLLDDRFTLEDARIGIIGLNFVLRFVLRLQSSIFSDLFYPK